MGIKRLAEEVTVNGGLCELIAGGCQNHGVMQFAAGGVLVEIAPRATSAE